MPIYQFEGRIPHIGEGTYVHPSAEVIGAVKIGARCWIGPGARLRGDYGEIIVGDETAVEDNCILHARPGDACRIGSQVTIGHGAIIHTATVEDFAIIGMGAVVSDWARVGEWAVVGEGAVVKNSQAVPAEHIAVGVPAQVLGRNITPEYKEQWAHFKATYVELARRYGQGLQQL